MARVRSLSGKGRFQKTYAEGVKRVGRLFVVYMMAAESDEMAVVASRKVGNAVQRNRAKRLLREALARCVFDSPQRTADIIERFCATRGQVAETNGSRNRTGGGLRIVAIARSGILAAKSRDVCREMSRMLD